MRIRDNKGSITVFVLVGLLFMTGFLIISFGSNINRSKNAKEQLNILSSIYSHGDTDLDAYERAYTAIRKKNAQILTETIENSFSLELTKTFTANVENLKIYGNSVQNGTPSPTNPVEVQSMGDKTSNLADLTKIQISTSTPHVTYNYDNFKSNLELTSTPGEYDYTYITDQNLGLEIGKTYYYGGDIVVSGKQTKNNTVVAFGLTDSTYTAHTFTKDGTKNVQGTFTYTGQSSVRLRMFFNYGSVEPAQVRFENIYVSEVNEYEPYGYKIPVKVSGKNIAKPNQRTVTINGISVIQNENGTITISGKALETKEVVLHLSNINVGGSFIKDHVRQVGTVMKAKCRNVDTNEIISVNTYWNGVNTGNKYYGENPIFNEPLYYMSTYIQKTINAGENPFAGTYELQVEYGDTSTDYERYVEPITTNIYLDQPLRKIGNYSDYIDYANGKAIRCIKESIYTGDDTENWQLLGNVASTSYYYYINIGNYGTVLSNIGLNTHFERKNISTSMAGIVGYNVTNSSTYNDARIIIRPDMTVYTNVSLWKEYLKEQYELGQPVKSYYVLATSDDTETIDLPEILTFEDYTNIEVLTEVAPSKIEATYYGYTME